MVWHKSCSPALPSAGGALVRGSQSLCSGGLTEAGGEWSAHRQRNLFPLPQVLSKLPPEPLPFHPYTLPTPQTLCGSLQLTVTKDFLYFVDQYIVCYGIQSG
uniref:Uncharacterized protein n=1 Tax=Knipowitschia caucasica TaxID=637954 RepID=A0AAV2LZR3_KNICA